MTGGESTYFVILGAWGLVALVTAGYLFVRPAPYGRHHRSGFGPAMGARLAWMVMEAPSPLGMVCLFVVGNRAGDRVAEIFLGLWLCHYLYRAFVYPWLLPASSRPMPIVVAGSGAFFNLVNAYLNGRWLFALGPLRPDAWLASPIFLLGTAMFFAGMAVHVLADRELRRIRAASGGRRGVPVGPLFRLVSCPNYTGEILEWTGFAIATWSPGGFIFALWTIANLVPRALHHHRWYRANFASYPRERRALVPFLF